MRYLEKVNGQLVADDNLIHRLVTTIARIDAKIASLRIGSGLMICSLEDSECVDDAEEPHFIRIGIAKDEQIACLKGLLGSSKNNAQQQLHAVALNYGILDNITINAALDGYVAQSN